MAPTRDRDGLAIIGRAAHGVLDRRQGIERDNLVDNRFVELRMDVVYRRAHADNSLTWAFGTQS
jgi:hypothetical protein